MRFLILRILTHSELGMFLEYRRQGKEGSKQRAINFDWDVVDRVFPAAKDTDRVEMDLQYESDKGIKTVRQWLKRQDKNWRLEGNYPPDKRYHFVDRGCMFAMEVDAGTSPASGSWTVFPTNDKVTQEILEHGETSRLAKSAMIALHDQEAATIWGILEHAKPKLFSAPGIALQVPYMNSAAPSGGVELAPNAGRLVDILASVGHTMPSAVADLVDNSVSANATEVAITFGRPDAGHGRWMAITDNGDGMTKDRLAEAMRIGSSSIYEGNSLGKYGYGLKGASWSQAKVFTVVTRVSGKNSNRLTWDRDDMVGWIAKSGPIEAWEAKAVSLGDHGTGVLWKEMRPPQTMPNMKGMDPYTAEITELERHLSLVFHRFLEGKAKGRRPLTITINGKKVEPNNPVGHPLTEAYDAKVVRVATAGQDGQVNVQAFLLPSEDELASYHAAGGQNAIKQATDLIGLYGKRNETQGLFIYRHDRLIKWGGWHQMWETNDEKTKLARVVVDFDKALDDAFKINISKQQVQLSQQIQAEIKRIANFPRTDSQKKYRRQPQLNSTPPGSIVPKTKPGAPTGTLGQSTPTTSQTPSQTSSISAPPPQPPTPVVELTTVTTDKFAWKVTKDLSGKVKVQVSNVSPNLAALVSRIRSDAAASASLAAFLAEVDDPELRKHFLASKS